jgi:uncharacterized protein YidB (DUF937 family)
MDILNKVLDTVKSHSSDATAAEGSDHGVFESVLGLLNNPDTGGFSGLLDKFTARGLDEQVKSWLSNGENLAIDGEQIKQALGSTAVQDIATKLGIDSSDLAEKLANVLPQIVDKMTPNGEVPSGANLLETGLNVVSSLLGNKTA